jgi:ribosomal protein S18 acetylase RimI-like enzyme
MPELEIQPFSEEHLEAAAGLLEQRHARHVEAEPLLAKENDFRAEIRALLDAEGSSGVAAIRDNRVAGYMLGIPKNEAMWGASNVWVDYAGHAAEEPELVRDLYAAAAANWHEAGRDRHYALVPATDPELVDAWFRLSFGAQHAAGIQETPERTDGAPPGVVVRRATADDVDAVVRLDFELPRHQEHSPVFGPGPTWTEEESREEFLADVDDAKQGILVAEVDGQIVSLLIMVPIEKSSQHKGLAQVENAAFLGFAATLPEARGSGAGLALTNAGLDWAREQGYPVVVVDWRETNLLASRFWPRRGFRRTFLRLYRSIP